MRIDKSMVYAVIETGGKQYRVEEGEYLQVEKLDAKRSIIFDKVLLCVDGDKIEIGKPYIKGLKVSAKIKDEGKDKKVIIFKFKRKTGYKRKIGHRQPYTGLLIDKISSKSSENLKQPED